ncbi:hypothetical protein WJX81_000358 [Elliptochloris bilobata]|uniref:Uncharacterized protein n=1 Tax=Elliptochloris bilobata TaxID=381761 RepID=A0AAW1SCJ8_9CHLO
MHGVRSRASTRGGAEAALENLGCRGRSHLLEALTYAAAVLWERLTAAHMALEGVGKQLMGLFLQKVSRGETRPPYVMSNAVKAELRRRGAHMRLTTEFGRPYRNVTVCHRLYTMEDWLRFWEVHVPYLSRGSLLDEPFAEMNDAAAALGGHAPVPRGGPQGPQPGPGVHDGQHRPVHGDDADFRPPNPAEAAAAHAPTHERVSRAPELASVRHILLQQTLRAARAADSELSRLLAGEQAPASGGPGYDSCPDARTDTRLLHKGVQLAGADCQLAVQQALECVGVRLPGGGEVPDKGKRQAALRDVRAGRLAACVHRLRAALRGGVHTVHSTRNKHSTKKTSRFVAPVAPRRGRAPAAPQEHIAEVLHFVRVCWLGNGGGADAPPAEPLRLAVCCVCKPLPPEDDMLVADTGTVLDERAFAVDQLGQVLVTAELAAARRLYGIKYGNRSQLQ